jgi:glycosyltransferase involved in cell wall biosynthesis
MNALVRETAQAWQPDAVVALTFVTAPYAAQLPVALKVLDIDNYMARMLYDLVALAGSQRERLRRWLAYRKFLSYERRLYAQFDLCLAVTQADRRQMIDKLRLRQEQVTVTPNGVDTVQNHPGLGRPEPDVLVYSGAVTYSANYDAVEYFVQQIYPLILKETSEVRLRVTGRTDGVDLGGLTQTGCVEFTGYVDDVRSAIAGGSVCIVPLRMGGGTRLKILEAMALGVAVVSTSKGAEGLDVTHGEHLLIADTAEAFAEATVQLLRSPELRSRLVGNAVQRVRELYDWEHIGATFCQMVEEHL